VLHQGDITDDCGRTVASPRSHGRYETLKRVHATKVTSPPRTQHISYWSVNRSIWRRYDDPSRKQLVVVLASSYQVSLIRRPKIILQVILRDVEPDGASERVTNQEREMNQRDTFGEVWGQKITFETVTVHFRRTGSENARRKLRVA
jgi:hypothetical protein